MVRIAVSYIEASNFGWHYVTLCNGCVSLRLRMWQSLEYYKNGKVSY